MRSFIALPVFLSLFLNAARPVYGDINGIAARDIYEAIEHILVDNKGFNSDGLVDAISPCSNYINGNDNNGEQSTAQWVRVAFHDIATADVAAGTGGMDASVGFESDRAENPGLFINQTLPFFNPDISAYVSMADMIALGVVTSVATCGGTTTDIPLRTGRIDATEAGPSGVPEPQTDINTTLTTFEKAGFNQSAAIGLTACGHSLGRIHYTNFPDIVNQSYVTSTNEDGGQEFDSTPAVFDSTVVTEYLQGSGQKGGPLVTTANVSQRSDFRLYTSDDNATMESLGASETSFQTQCNLLFEQMIDTVPGDVVLSDPITPMTYKGVDLNLDINSAGNVSIGGYIRYLYASGSALSSVSYTYTANGANSSTKATTGTAGTGTSLYGSTEYYNFNTTIESPGTIALNINDAISYPINDEIFIVPAKSTTNTRSKSMTITAAVGSTSFYESNLGCSIQGPNLTSFCTKALTNLTGDSMTAVLYVPTTQQSSKANKVVNTTLALTKSGTAGGYTLYSGSTSSVSSIGPVIVKAMFGDYASQTVDSSIFG